MTDTTAPTPGGEPFVMPAAGSMPTDPAAADDAVLKELLAGSGGAEVVEALAREWRGEQFRENLFHAVRVLSLLDGTGLGERLREAGLLKRADLWRQAARLGRALASETGQDDGPARRGRTP